MVPNGTFQVKSIYYDYLRFSKLFFSKFQSTDSCFTFTDHLACTIAFTTGRYCGNLCGFDSVSRKKVFQQDEAHDMSILLMISCSRVRGNSWLHLQTGLPNYGIFVRLLPQFWPSLDILVPLRVWALTKTPLYYWPHQWTGQSVTGTQWKLNRTKITCYWSVRISCCPAIHPPTSQHCPHLVLLPHDHNNWWTTSSDDPSPCWGLGNDEIV